MIYDFAYIWADSKAVKNEGFLANNPDFDEWPMRAKCRWCFENELPQHALANEFIVGVISTASKFEAIAYQGQGSSKPLKNFGSNCSFLVQKKWKEGNTTYLSFNFDIDKFRRYYHDYLNQLTAVAVAAARKNTNSVQYEWEHTIFVPVPEFVTQKTTISKNIERVQGNILLDSSYLSGGVSVIKIVDTDTGNIVPTSTYKVLPDNPGIRVKYDSQLTSVNLRIDYEYDGLILSPSCQTFTTPIDISALFNENIKLSDYPGFEVKPYTSGDWKDCYIDSKKNPKQTIEVLALGWVGSNTKPGIVVDNDIDGAHIGDIWTRFKDGVLIGCSEDLPNTPLYELFDIYDLYGNIGGGMARISGYPDPVTGTPCLRLMNPICTEIMEIASDFWLGYNQQKRMQSGVAGIVFKIRKVANGIAPAFQQSIES